MRHVFLAVVFALLLLAPATSQSLEFNLEYVYEQGEAREIEGIAGVPLSIQIINFQAEAEEVAYLIETEAGPLEGVLRGADARSFGPNALVYSLDLAGGESAQLFYDFSAPEILIVYTSAAVLTYRLSGL
jgi:hypothetical protein